MRQRIPANAMTSLHKIKDCEIRQDKATGQWVIYSRSRSKRPKDFRRKESGREKLAVFDANCPFCPGNETMLPQLLFEMQRPGSREWMCRVAPNKFPALRRSGTTARYAKGIYVAMDGFGSHEVIIESPHHNRQMADMSKKEVCAILETYHRRYVDLMEEHENMMTIIFRNHGPLAGTSLIHPHSQIIVTGMVPHHIRWREQEAQRYFDAWGKCVYCDILGYEMKERKRIVFENASFLAFVPYAANVPFEIWILPKKHEADFGAVSDAEKDDLSDILRDCIARLHTKLHDPDYNYVFNTAARYRSGEPQLHWYLEIRPRLTTRAGFEIGSGVNINPSVPEDDAAFLRGA